MEPDAVSHYTEAGVNFLLMDGAALQIETGLMVGGWGKVPLPLSCLGGETGR